MSWKWYSVKTLYRYRAHGRPKSPDDHYAAGQTMVEERVVLIRARSFDDALRRGEAEAKAYVVPGAHTNPFGQKVTVEYLDVADAFELAEDPDSCVEVYSSTGLVPSKISDTALLDVHLGKRETHPAERTQFLNGELSGREWWKGSRTSR